MHTVLPYSGTSLLTATHKHMLAESPVPKHQLPKPPCLQIQHGTHDRIYPDIFGISRNYSRSKDHIFCVPDLYRSTHLFHRKVCQNLFSFVCSCFSTERFKTVCDTFPTFIVSVSLTLYVPVRNSHFSIPDMAGSSSRSSQRPVPALRSQSLF